MSKKKALGLGAIAGIGAGIFLISKMVKGNEPPSNVSIGMKWGENAETGPQTIVYGTSEKLVLTTKNPTAEPWTYDIKWLCNGNIGAAWNGVHLEAGEQADLDFEVIFGSYIPGDTNFDGIINNGDYDKILRIIQGYDSPSFAADINGDGVVDVGDRLKVDRIASGLDDVPATVEGIVSGAGTYSSVVVVKEITTGKEWTFDFDDITIVVQEPTMGQLVVESNPTGATISVDGVSMGVAPCTLTLEAGEHTVTAFLDEHYERTQTVLIEADKTSTLTFNMVDVYNLLISSTPPGASIYINDEFEGITFSGETKLRVIMSPGTYTVTATMDNYLDNVKEITIDTESTIDLNFVMELAPIVVEPAVEIVSLKWPGGSVSPTPNPNPTYTYSKTFAKSVNDSYDIYVVEEGGGVLASKMFGTIKSYLIALFRMKPAEMIDGTYKVYGWEMLYDERQYDNPTFKDVMINNGDSIFIMVDTDCIAQW